VDWSNERYVRLYVRDTAEWLCMSWQARAFWPLLIRKMDRSGVIQTKLGVRGLAALTGFPLEHAEVGIVDLLMDGCLREHPFGYLAPNFMEAQEAISSDAQRQRESRLRRRLVTERDIESQNVSKSHAVSRAVTDGHAVSRAVTPSLAVPSGLGRAGSDAPLVSDFPPDLALSPDSQANPPKLKRARAKRAPVAAHRLPPDWAPRQQELDKASAMCLQVALEIERFRDHHTAKGTEYVDWDAAFRTWLGNTVRFANGTVNGRHGPTPAKTPIELQFERIRMLEEQERAEKIG
jgi:hypothetical protein